jgi:hypothetical protein
MNHTGKWPPRHSWDLRFADLAGFCGCFFQSAFSALEEASTKSGKVRRFEINPLSSGPLAVEKVVLCI